MKKLLRLLLVLMAAIPPAWSYHQVLPIALTCYVFKDVFRERGVSKGRANVALSVGEQSYITRRCGTLLTDVSRQNCINCFSVQPPSTAACTAQTTCIFPTGAPSCLFVG